MKKLFLLTAVLTASCGLPPLIITIEDDVRENHALIEAEIIEALDFFCAKRSVDCHVLQEDMEIVVKEEYFVNGVECGGNYTYPMNRVIITHSGGPGHNALFHELLHAEAIHTSNRKLHHNNPAAAEEFSSIFNNLREEWRCRNEEKN